VNASRSGRFGKRAVFNAVDTAGEVFRVTQASFFFRFLAVSRPREVGAFSPFQRGGLLGFGFVRSDRAKSSLTNFLPRFGRADVLAVIGKNVRVALQKMFSLGKGLKVVKAIVFAVAVYVVNLLAGVETFQPAMGDHTVQQPVPVPARNIPVAPNVRRVGLELSENFPAPRNRKDVVVDAKADTVNIEANHGVSFEEVRGFILTHFIRRKQQ
jgi:hypothetical protein